MKHLLSADIGNSKTRVCYHEGDKIISSKLLSPEENFPDTQNPIIISSVLKKSTLLRKFPSLGSSNICNVSNLIQDQHFLSMPIHYNEGLGADRIACAYLAFTETIQDHTPRVIIDAGSFVTIDFVNLQGFIGGFIFPNPKEILSLYKKGDQLPTVNSAELLKFKSLPQSTNDAILKAVSLFYEGAFSKVIPSNSSIILTGGASSFFKNLLENHHIKKDDLYIHKAMAKVFSETHL